MSISRCCGRSHTSAFTCSTRSQLDKLVPCSEDRRGSSSSFQVVCNFVFKIRRAGLLRMRMSAVTAQKRNSLRGAREFVISRPWVRIPRVAPSFQPLTKPCLRFCVQLRVQLAADEIQPLNRPDHLPGQSITACVTISATTSSSCSYFLSPAVRCGYRTLEGLSTIEHGSRRDSTASSGPAIRPMRRMPYIAACSSTSPHNPTIRVGSGVRRGCVTHERLTSGQPLTYVRRFTPVIAGPHQVMRSRATGQLS
jgi:hypothetical protein